MMDRDSCARSTRRNAPLNPLRAFEAAARHLNFTQAADELGVTQGAVSRSVRVLEDYMGQPLFERCHNGGLLLYDRSNVLARRLTEIFDRLVQATLEFRGHSDTSVLTVRTYTSFLIGFLLPNLVDFQVKHPKLRLRLISGTDSVEFVRGHEDVRIRYGRGKWAGFDSTLLFYDQLRPVCSPKLLDPTKRPYSPQVLTNLVLLHKEHCRSDWLDWLACANSEKIAAKDHLAFDELSVAYEAALSGKGIVIAQKRYLAREIREGQLFEPFDTVLHRDLGYYLTIPHEFRDVPKVLAFKTWLFQAFHALDLDNSASVISDMRKNNKQEIGLKTIRAI
jgi:LysR family glycine cleavage system transcriptional activator